LEFDISDPNDFNSKRVALEPLTPQAGQEHNLGTIVLPVEREQESQAAAKGQ